MKRHYRSRSEEGYPSESRKNAYLREDVFGGNSYEGYKLTRKRGEMGIPPVSYRRGGKEKRSTEWHSGLTHGSANERGE